MMFSENSFIQHFGYVIIMLTAAVEKS